MIDFKVDKNVILSSLITGVYDVNRSETLKDDDFSAAEAWAKSITNLKLQGIIFHNNLVTFRNFRNPISTFRILRASLYQYHHTYYNTHLVLQYGLPRTRSHSTYNKSFLAEHTHSF